MPALAPEQVDTYDPSGEDARAKDRTRLGLQLLMVGFALAWIPYVSDVGGLISLIGVIMMWLGRRAFGQQHHMGVLLGAGLFLLGLLIIVVDALWFASALVASVTGPTASAQSLGSAFQSTFQTFLIVAVVAGAIELIGNVAFAYALAPQLARRILVAAVFVALVVSAVVLSIVVPQISTAVTQAFAGSTANPVPIQELQTQDSLLQSVQVLPDMMFVFAYYLTIQQAFGPPRLAPIAPPPTPPSNPSTATRGPEPALPSATSPKSD